MSIKRATQIRNKLLLTIVTLAAGIAIGVIVRDFPLFSLKYEVDIGMLATLVGLFITVYIMPFIVEKKLSNTANINGIIVHDLEAILANVESLKTQFSELSPTKKVTEKQYRYVLSTFKTVSSSILALHEQAKSRGKIVNIKDEVYDQYYTPAYETCTERLVYDRTADERTLMDAQNTLNMLAANLRKYRYETYSQ